MSAVLIIVKPLTWYHASGSRLQLSSSIIIFIYNTRTEHKIQKLNSVNQKYGRLYQRSYSSFNWPPMLIKQN